MSAMFFNSVMLDLHHELLDHLCSPTVHGVIPLLHVNRHFRQLAINRLANELKATKVYQEESEGDQSERSYIAKGGAYVKICRSLPSQEAAILADDPRFVVTRPQVKDQESFIFSSIDRETLKITLKPLKPELDTIYSQMEIDPKDLTPLQQVAQSYEIVSTGWFRPAGKDSKTKLFGLELAANPNRYPTIRNPAFCPTVAEPGDVDTLVRDDVEPEKGWNLECTTIRPDLDVELAGFIVENSDEDEISHKVPTLLKIDRFEIPLINLFVPPQTSRRKPCFKNEEYECDYD